MNIVYDRLGQLTLTLTYVDALGFVRKTTTLVEKEVIKVVNSHGYISYKHNKIGIPLPCKMVED
jgi:hypothetical protein